MADPSTELCGYISELGNELRKEMRANTRTMILAMAASYLMLAMYLQAALK